MSGITESVPIAVKIVVDKNQSIINQAVAFVVHPVADFGGIWIDGCIIVVAVHIVKKAIAICNTCDVIAECRDYGLTNEKRGVWGGVLVGRKGPTMRRDAA